MEEGISLSGKRRAFAVLTASIIRSVAKRRGRLTFPGDNFTSSGPAGKTERFKADRRLLWISWESDTKSPHQHQEMAVLSDQGRWTAMVLFLHKQRRYADDSRSESGRVRIAKMKQNNRIQQYETIADIAWKRFDGHSRQKKSLSIVKGQGPNETPVFPELIT